MLSVTLRHCHIPTVSVQWFNQFHPLLCVCVCCVAEEEDEEEMAVVAPAEESPEEKGEQGEQEEEGKSSSYLHFHTASCLMTDQ